MSEAHTSSKDKPPGGDLYDYKGKLLIAEPPLQVLPTLAKLLKLGPAMFLQQVHWWVHFGHAEKGVEITEHAGRTWVRLTPEILERKFSFVDHRTLQRYVSSLRTAGVLLTENLNKIRLDPTLWYAVDYERLHQLEQGITSPPDPANPEGENSVVHDNDILSFASATQKKPVSKHRSGNDNLSSSTCDKLSPSTCDNLSPSTCDNLSSLYGEELRKEEQQQPRLALVAPADAVDVVVDSSPNAERKAADAPTEDGAAVENIEALVHELVALKTGAAAKAIRQAVEANPSHAAYWLHEWEGELPHLPSDQYSLAALLLARLRDVGTISTRDLAQQARNRTEAAREQRAQQPAPVPAEGWAERESAQRQRRAEASREETDRLDEAFSVLSGPEREAMDAAILQAKPFLKAGSPGLMAERRVQMSARLSEGVTRETPQAVPQAVGELLAGVLPEMAQREASPAPPQEAPEQAPGPTPFSRAMLDVTAALEKRLKHGLDREDLDECRDSIGAMLHDDEWDEVVARLRQAKAA